MTTFRTRLLVALISLLLVVLVVLGLLLGQLFKGYYLNVADQRFEKESTLVAEYVAESGGIRMISSEKVNHFSQLLNAKLTVVDLNGHILQDSGKMGNIDDKTITNIINEISQMGDDDKEQNRTIIGSNLHYYWEPVIINGQKEGFILLCTELTEIEQAYQQIWWILIISFSLAFIAISILGYKIMIRYTKPIEMATNVAMELAKGNYQARTYEEDVDETGMLNVSINILARNLQNMVKTHEIQNDRLSILIENVGSALILIDSRGYINLINRTYKEIFDVNLRKRILNKLYYEVIEHSEINKIIEDIFMTETKMKKQFILPLKIERRHFEVYGVPIIGTNDVWKGILLVFHDITEIKKIGANAKGFCCKCFA